MPGDFEEAAKWYIKAAEQGHAYAQYILGRRYYGGDGVKQCYAKAVKWYTKAAEQGYAYAQYSLGLCYHEGEGVKKDIDEAKKWFTLASNNDNKKALEFLIEIKQAQCNIKKINQQTSEINTDLYDENRIKEILEEIRENSSIAMECESNGDRQGFFEHRRKAEELNVDLKAHSKKDFWDYADKIFNAGAKVINFLGSEDLQEKAKNFNENCKKYKKD